MSEKQKHEHVIAVIDRMILAGWIRTSARRGDIASSELTSDGVHAIRSLRRFLSQNEGKLPSAQLAAFLALIASPSLKFLDEPIG